MAKYVFRSDARWRIGKGDRVMVWADLWLPNMGNPWVESSPTTGLEFATKESLMRLDGTGWDEDILRAYFKCRDKRLIQQIPLSTNSPQDRWQWHYELKG